MTHKRMIALFGAFLLAFAVVMGRLFLLANNTGYATTAQNQTVTTLTLANQRGSIYDCKGRNLTGFGTRYYALSIPGESSYSELFQYVPYSSQALLYQNRNSTSPFLVEVSADLTSKGIYTYAVPDRYFPLAIAPHFIGYVDGDGNGVSGLELAFDELLGQNRTASYVQCVTTAQGALLQDTEPELLVETQNSMGVMVTLDETIQRASEGIAQKYMTQGCIVVMDTATGKVRAMVSMPEFHPTAVEKSIQAQDTSLLNRAFCSYNVGSVFKPVLAAAALERGWDWYTYECEGSININDHIYSCALNRSHEQVNLTKGLGKSCNCFFIQLGLDLGAERVCQMAEKFGFGQPTYVSGGLKSAAGNMPDAAQLKDIGELANVSFGQGMLTATPIQLAAAMNVIANDGQYRTPSFLEGTVDEVGKTLQDSLYQPETKRAIAEETAATLRTMLEWVVEDGIGKDAAPEYGTAAGKTGTAQTSVFNEAGDELMNYWFTGFYPAESPRYTIVVLQDGTPEPEVSSAAIFAKVCDSLYWLGEGVQNS